MVMGRKRFLPKFQTKILLKISMKYLPKLQTTLQWGLLLLGRLGLLSKLLDQHLVVQANRDMLGLENTIGGMGAYKVIEFLRMNPPELYFSKVEEYQNTLVEEVYNVLAIMGMFSIRKDEISTYQLKGVSQISYEQRKDRCQIGAGLIKW